MFALYYLLIGLTLTIIVTAVHDGLDSICLYRNDYEKLSFQSFLTVLWIIIVPIYVCIKICSVSYHLIFKLTRLIKEKFNV